MLTTQQLNERRLGVGGSDVAAILGFDPWRNIMDVYNEKVHGINNTETTLPMKVGNKLESLIADEYEERFPDKVCWFKVDDEGRPIPFIHPYYPHRRVNTDRLISDKKEVALSTVNILECKTANAFMKKQWGPEGSDKYPFNYKLQIAYYRAVMNVDYVDLMVLIGNSDLRVYRYEKNEEFERRILEAVDNFWFNHVVPQIPPSTRIEEVDIKEFDADNIEEDVSMISDVDTVHKCILLKGLGKQIKLLQDEYDIIKNDVIDYLGDKYHLLDEVGNKIASYMPSTRTSFDADRLKKEKPDLYKAFCKITSSQTFRLGK